MTMQDALSNPAFGDAAFVLVGYGDGRGTEVVHGYQALVARVLADCGEDIDADGLHDEWHWSDETPSLPYSLHLSFESDGLTIIRLGASARAALAAPPSTPSLQARVAPWMQACFGPEISANQAERNHRFLEEALELVQACGCTRGEAEQLVAYVYGRPIGEPGQEVGGVMVTLAALCLAADMDMHQAGETELARIWTKVEQIRAKQAAKPKHSPLPQHVPAGSGSTRLHDLIAAAKADGPMTEDQVAAQRANWASAEMELDRKQDRECGQ